MKGPAARQPGLTLLQQLCSRCGLPRGSCQDDFFDTNQRGFLLEVRANGGDEKLDHPYA